MTYTRLQLINHTLSLIGENQLSTSANQLGTLAVNVLNTAFSSVAQDSRHSSFEIILTGNITEADYLNPAYSIPLDVLQVYKVFVKTTDVTNGYSVLDELEYLELDCLFDETGYSIIGNNLYLTRCITRPFTIQIQAVQNYELPALDSDVVDLPDQVLQAVAHTAASILSLSYLDNPNAAATQSNLRNAIIDKLQKQSGSTRAKTFNISKKTKTRNRFATIPTSVEYAALFSPAFTGVPTAPTAPYLTNTTQLATTAFVQTAIGSSSSTAMTLLNSFTNFGTPYSDATANKHTNSHIVQLNGVLARTSIPSVDTTMFTLPTGYRPSTNRLFVCPVATNTGDGFVLITISASSGNVNWFNFYGTAPSSPSSIIYMSLDNLSFSVL